MKNQRGYIWKVGRSWHGRWYRNELSGPDANGERQLIRRQHSEKLCEVSDRYRSKKDVQVLLTEKLLSENNDRSRAESTLSVASYVREFFFPFCERELKPSTVNGYKGLFRTYLRARLENLSLRDARCVDVTNILAAIHREHKVNRKSIQNCKGLLSTIFTHAKRAGVLDGINPCEDAGIPRAALPGKPTHAYSLDDIFAMLNALEGTARTAVALMFFCGLRPGEAKGAKWSDYDGKTLRIRCSVWRHHETLPKTAESVASVPIPEPLREILEESRRESGDESRRESGYILESLTGLRVHLENLSQRTIRPALARCAICQQEKADHDSATHEFKSLPAWHGWYACRRGWATLATSVDSALAAKSLLRHSNIATTQAHYIKSIPADALRAVEKINALCEKSANEVLN